ncbi:HNH endonuclease signature motif containing protein [Deinococcus aerolatus]|nr:HNH endonuclease signature motif containing protein [Deinococcus aerolatus]
MSAPAPTGPQSGPITRLRHAPHPERLRQRFWAQVRRGAEAECWLWAGGTGNSGYGLFRLGPRKVGAHRVAWMLTHGELPPSALHVCHTCDTPLCVCPAHLFLGSHRENMRDATVKGRKKGRGGRTGEGNGRARLNAPTVIRLRALPYRRGLDTELARALGVSVSAVYLARTGQTWTSLPMPGAPGWEAALARPD